MFHLEASVKSRDLRLPCLIAGGYTGYTPLTNREKMKKNTVTSAGRPSNIPWAELHPDGRRSSFVDERNAPAKASVRALPFLSCVQVRQETKKVKDRSFSKRRTHEVYEM